ncbi:MAG: ATP-binding protein [Deltaproteobacteria bacterium]|nr:ATP-binding protein [Deltaproteobacteria bacterium]
MSAEIHSIAASSQGYSDARIFIRDLEEEICLRTRIYLSTVGRLQKEKDGVEELSALQTALKSHHTRMQLGMRLATVDLPFVRWMQRFGLSDAEQILVAYLLFLDEGVRLRHLIEKRAGALDPHSPRVALAIAGGTPDAAFTLRSILSATGAIARASLLVPINLDQTDIFSDLHLHLNADVVALLLDDPVSLSHLRRGTSIERPTERLSSVVLPHATRAVLERVIRVSGQESARPHIDCQPCRVSGTVLLLTGPPGTGKTLTARAIAGTLDRPLVLMASAEYHHDLTPISIAMTEARRLGGIFFIDEFDKFMNDVDLDRLRAVLRVLDEPGLLTILAANKATPFHEAVERRILYRLELPLPDVYMRRQLWQKHLPAELSTNAPVIEALSEVPFLAGGEIRNACLAAKQQSEAATDPGHAIQYLAQTFHDSAYEQLKRVEDRLQGVVQILHSGLECLAPPLFSTQQLSVVVALVRGVSEAFLTGNRSIAERRVGLFAEDMGALKTTAHHIASAVNLPCILLPASFSMFRDEDAVKERLSTTLRALNGRFVAAFMEIDKEEAWEVPERYARYAAFSLLLSKTTTAATTTMFQSLLMTLEADPQQRVVDATTLRDTAASVRIDVAGIDWDAVTRHGLPTLREMLPVCRLALALAVARGQQNPGTQDLIHAAELRKSRRLRGGFGRTTRNL